MKNIIFLILVEFLLINNLYAQLIEGEVAIFNKGIYSMQDNEDWARVNVNGGLYFNRRGYINFKENEIIFVIGSTESREELYNSYKFKYDHERKYFIMSTQDIPISDNFSLLDSNNSDVLLTYLSGNNFKSKKGVFVFSIYGKNTMYFLAPYNDETIIMNSIYQEN